jgi:hypothetical protein
MSLQKYLQAIEGIDPGKIYVENVRSIYNVSSLKARVLCEMAVQENIFVKKIGVVCPNSDCRRIIAQYDSYADIPKQISCDICEAEGDKECLFNTADLDKIEFYQLKDRNA